MTRHQYNNAVKTISDKLYGFLFFHLKDEEESRDIVQEVFTKLWENRKTVDPNKITKWLFVSAHHKLIDFTRREKLKRESTKNFISDHSYQDTRFENQHIIHHCLDHLPTLQKTIVLLRDNEGYSYKEISEITELSEAQIKVYLFRARKKFRETYVKLSKTESI